MLFEFQRAEISSPLPFNLGHGVDDNKSGVESLGRFRLTSAQLLMRTVVCSSIYERGSATTSIQLLHEPAVQWKRALQESLRRGWCMLWSLRHRGDTA